MQSQTVASEITYQMNGRIEIEWSARTVTRQNSPPKNNWQDWQTNE